MLDINQYVFERVRQKMPKSKDLAVVLAELLHLSKSAVYRKISGEVPLTLHEMVSIARKFNISLDNHILGSTKDTGFRFEPLDQPEKDTDINYYLNMYAVFKKLIDRDPSTELYISTQELSPFHYMNFPELMSFQILLWSKSTMRWATVEDEDFRIEERAQNPELLTVSHNLLQLYHKVPGVEFIAPGIIDKNIIAISQFAKQSIFKDPATPLLLCEQLELMVKHVGTMAKAGKKIPYNDSIRVEKLVDYTLYYDMLANYSTNVYFRSEANPIIFCMLEFPNFMTTQSPNMIAYYEKWKANCKSKSSRISSEGEMTRNQLLQTFFGKIDRLKQELKR